MRNDASACGETAGCRTRPAKTAALVDGAQSCTCEIAIVDGGQQGHFAVTAVKTGPDGADFKCCIMQRCLPSLRQQAGNLDSGEVANAGASGVQPNTTTSRIATLRHIQPECSVSRDHPISENLRYTRALTRRSISTLLTLVYSVLLTLPLFAPSDESRLPACCRKDGKHHCAMQSSRAIPDGSVTANGAKCRLFPQFAPASHLETVVASSRSSDIGYAVTQSAITPPTDIPRIVFDHSAELKRGPPQLLLV